MDSWFIGIDVGTQGVRVALVSNRGEVLGGVSKPLPLTASSREEQSPQQWWSSCLLALDELFDQLPAGCSRAAIQAMGVSSTSGTVIPLDAAGTPLHDALMYSDGRSVEAGKRCSQLAAQYVPTGYTGFNASSGLSKMVWFVNQYPEKAERIDKWIHAADYITGSLCGDFGVTDYTNALKSGYDVAKAEWPAYLTRELPLQASWFQQVVPSGTPVGTLKKELSSRFGLPQLQVVAGMTDGCASQVASGAVRPGDWNTTIGTTLVIKGVTHTPINDPQGRIYSHRHPDGYWMPGGASNTGADWVSTDFGSDLDALNTSAALLVPTGQLVWPLKQQGERFPFVAPQARGFAPENLSGAVLFAASMEGVAYMERYAYALIAELSGERVAAVYTAGGGSNSDTWLAIRASVLQVPILKCRDANGAVGAAICAASKTTYRSIAEAAGQMTQVVREFLPNPEWVKAYDESYRRFIDVLTKLKYN